MTTEKEKRLHRCCFSGHRPEKLAVPEEEVRQWLAEQIDLAIAAGYTTFITGCGMGVDIWAGQIVLRKKTENPALRLIAATPWPGFPAKWNTQWQTWYRELLKEADLVVPISRQYRAGIFRERNEWMVNHSSRLIALYNGAPGGTRDTIDYALSRGIEVITNNPTYEPEKKRERKQKEEAPKYAYPENILRDIGLKAVFGTDEYTELTEEQLAGLAYAAEDLPERVRTILELRYRENQTLQVCGDHFGFSRERARQVIQKGIRILRHEERMLYIREGFEKGELTLKLQCAESMKSLLRLQQKRYPLMTEEDVVKFVFQGMLGVGHLISSEEKALAYLHAEMAGLEPDGSEPLTESLSPEWFRLNLRAALSNGIGEKDICRRLIRSSRRRPLSFTRQNVYNFCVKLNDSEKMKTAAARVLDDNWLPGHSERYREAYHPAYRVLHRDFRSFSRK